RCIGMFALGNIELYTNQSHRIAGLILEYRGPAGNPPHRTIRPDHSPLRLEAAYVQRLRHQPRGDLTVIRMDQLFPGFPCPGKSTRREAIYCLQFPRPLNDASLEIPLKSSDTSHLLREAQALLARTHGFFRASPFRNIADDSLRAAIPELYYAC